MVLKSQNGKMIEEITTLGRKIIPFAVTSGSPASRLDSYDRYNGEVSESMTSKEKSFTLVVDGVTVCSNEPISNVGKVDKVIGNYRYIF